MENKTLKVEIKITDGNNIAKVEKEITEDCYFIRNSDTQKISTKTFQYDIQTEEEIVLFRARKSLIDSNEFEIINPVPKNIKRDKVNYLTKKAWLFIKDHKDLENSSMSENNEEYVLNENDLIKIGAKIYEIIEKKIEKENNIIDPKLYNISELNKKKGNIFDISLDRNQYYLGDDELKKKEEESKESEVILLEDDSNIKVGKCGFDSICSSDKSSKENPKLRLCKCEQWYHFRCFKNLIISKLRNRISYNEKGTTTTYKYHNFNCQKCLTPYPLRFIINDKLYKLVDYYIPKSDYIVLESIDNFQKEDDNVKMIHVIELSNPEIEINIGRHINNDIIEDESNISRYHSVIKYNKENGKLTIENKSTKDIIKTKVLIKDNIHMKKKKLFFNVEKSIITAYIE